MNSRTKSLVRGSISTLVDAGAVSKKEFEELARIIDGGGGPALLTRAETARILNISTRSVIRLMGSGILPTVRTTPRSVRIPAESVFEFSRTGMKGGAR